MTDCPYTAKDWRERAEQVRIRAEQLTDPDAKRAAFEVAAGYDQLAAMAARGASRLASA
jgi:hypothetical protein